MRNNPVAHGILGCGIEEEGTQRVYAVTVPKNKAGKYGLS